MKDLIHLHKTFEKVVYTGQKVSSREFENCIFKNCDFSNTAFLSSTFMDCEFMDCNLSMIELSGSSLKNVTFKDCKLLGIAFHACDDFCFRSILKIRCWILPLSPIKKCRKQSSLIRHFGKLLLLEQN